MSEPTLCNICNQPIPGSAPEPSPEPQPEPPPPTPAVPEEVNIDEIKMKTMYKMIDECKVSVQGKEVRKKVLYLTNKQASLFTEEIIEKCIQALEIPTPKFVIKLCRSLGVESVMMSSHLEMIGHWETQYELSRYMPSEIDQLDERSVESQFLMFLKTCILPLAKQTRALILIDGTNDCFLSYALSTMVLAEQARLGKACPFTVLATANAYEVISKACCKDDGDARSLVAQLAAQCPAWKQRLEYIYKSMDEEDLMTGKCDLSPAASHYIVFEGLDVNPETGTGPPSDEQSSAFDSVFMEYLTRKLPCIAIQSHLSGNGKQSMADLLARKIPLLLVDNTERAITGRHPSKSTEPYNTVLAVKAKAFPWIPISKLKDVTVQGTSVSIAGRRQIVKLAEEMMIRHFESFADASLGDVCDANFLSFWVGALNLGASVRATRPANKRAALSIYDKIVEMEKLQKANKEAKKMSPPPELVSRVVNFFFTKRSAYRKLSALRLCEKWLKKHDPQYDSMIPEAEEERTKLEKSLVAIREEGMTYTDGEIDAGLWVALFDILSSPYVYSGSVHDIDNLKNIIGSIAKIDRLPSANSLEALRLLRDAWDNVELYHSKSKFYKIVTITTYILVLLASIAVTLMILIQSIYGINTKVVIIALSFFNTSIVAYLSFVNPALKWQRLRSSALTIESNIWQFRTRTGPYRVSQDSDREAEEKFAACLAEVKFGILEGADLKTSAFYSQKSKAPLHGQRSSDDDGNGSNTTSFWARWWCFVRSVNAASRSKSLEEIEKAVIGMENADDEQEIPLLSIRAVSDLITEVPKSDIMYPDGPVAGATQASSATVSPSANKMQKKSKKPKKSTVVEAEDEEEEDEADEGEKKVVPIPEPVADLGPQTDMCIAMTDLVAFLRTTDSFEGEAEDNHCDPLQPNNYIRFRLLKMIEFYEGRIPRYNRTRYISQTLLIFGSLATGALSYFQLSMWSAAVTMITSAITAYLEFSGTTGKMTRYSTTVHALRELIHWWESLTPLDRAIVANVDNLILSAEDLLMKEMQAWGSSQSKPKEKDVGEGEGDSDAG